MVRSATAAVASVAKGMKRLMITPTLNDFASEAKGTPIILTSDTPIAGVSRRIPLTQAQADAYLLAVSPANIVATMARGYIDVPLGKRGRGTFTRQTPAERLAAALASAKAAKATAKAAKVAPVTPEVPPTA